MRDLLAVLWNSDLMVWLLLWLSCPKALHVSEQGVSSTAGHRGITEIAQNWRSRTIV
jgi:hypothetical protein